MTTALNTTISTTHSIVSTMLTRRRPGTRSEEGDPQSFGTQPNLSVGHSKTRRIWAGTVWKVLFLCLCSIVSFSSLLTVVHNKPIASAWSGNSNPWIETPVASRHHRVVFLQDAAVLWTAPERRVVERLGNHTAQRLVRRADDLHLTNVEKGDCRLRFEWQKTLYPNCNLLHELREENHRIVGNGYWRDVWVVEHINEKVVFKSMRYEHDNTHRNLDRMRRDANVMERMTSSPFIIDLYGFCGTSSFSEFGAGGDIVDALESEEGEEKHISQLGKLRIATQAAISLADLHNIDAEGEPTIAHTDITPGQFIKVNGRFKLNDFNRARFMAWDEKRNTVCPYYVGQNGGKFRSPEEYLYEEQTEKVDVFSLGNVFYVILQGEWPYDDIKTKKAQEMVIAGKGPGIYMDLWNSTDPVNQALKAAMMMCHVTNATERPSSREVEVYLKQQLRRLDPEYDLTIAATGRAE